MGVSPRVLENSSCQGDWKQFLDPATGEVGMKGRTLWLTCVLVVLVLGACSEDRITSPEPVDSGVPMPSTSALQLSQQETPDPNQVARAVPGFAGYFLDEAQRPTVYLTDTSRRSAAEMALAGWLASRGFTGASLQVRQAR